MDQSPEPMIEPGGYDSHIPALRAVARFMPIRSVIEFGGGLGSTFLFLDRTAFPLLESLITFENEPGWSEQLMTGDTRHRLIVVNADRFQEESRGMQSDFVFLDSGPTFHQRISLLPHCLTLARVVAIHDYQENDFLDHDFKYLRAFNSHIQTVFISNVTDITTMRLE